jgi:hypothetical protein
VQRTLLEAYRLQYILSGARHPHFAATLASLTTEAQLGRIGDALALLTPQAALRAASRIHRWERPKTMSANTKMQTKLALPSSNVVNGIDTDAVQMLIEGVETNSAKGMTHWRVASAWREAQTHEVDGFAIGEVSVPRSFSIDIDEPSEIGATNTHANPEEYLLATLNACIIVGYTALCALHGITLEKLEVATEG